MWVDGHRLDLIVQNCVIPGTVLTMLLRRWTMPVVPAVLPKAGFLRLRDYRLVALARHRWWVTAYSVAVGALTHLSSRRVHPARTNTGRTSGSVVATSSVARSRPRCGMLR